MTDVTTPELPAVCDIGDLLRNSQAFCMAPWVNLTVHVGGATAPCCEIKGRFGDARNQPLAEI
jgi:hypothetical protein